MSRDTLGGVVLVLIGIGILVGVFMFPFSTYQEIQSHQTTDAEILSTDIAQKEELDDGETEIEYYPRVEYRYTVDGETYTDTRIFHSTQVNNEEGELRGKEYDERSDAQDIVDKYPEGGTAQVYYDPSDPSTSYLEDATGNLLMTVVGGGLFGVVALAAGVGGLLGLVDLND